MNEQNFSEYIIPADSVESADQNTNSTAVNSDPFADKVTEDAALVHETPMGGTVAAVGPMNEPRDYETPKYEPPVQEIPVAGAVAAVGPINEVNVQEEAPMGQTITHEAPVVTGAVTSVALLSHEESEHFRTRWNEIQGTFVDDPRSAVQQADVLVSEVIQQIIQMFANEHNSLEGQWKQGNDVSTEDLRKALQHYRSFFKRLVV